MSRTPLQRRLFIAAILVGTGPLVAGTLAALSRRHDLRMIAMAVASGIVTFVVLKSGRVKTTAAVFAVSLLLATVIAAGVAYAAGARAPFGVWAVAFVLSLFWSACAVLLLRANTIAVQALGHK